MSTARIEVESTTVHHLTLSLPDDVLAPISVGDEVRIVIHSRGRSIVKRLTPAEVHRLLEQPSWG